MSRSANGCFHSPLFHDLHFPCILKSSEGEFILVLYLIILYVKLFNQTRSALCRRILTEVQCLFYHQKQIFQVYGLMHLEKKTYFGLLLIACDHQCSSQIRKLATFVTSSYPTLQGPLSRFSNELCTLVSNPSEKWPLKNSIHVSYILTSIIQKIPLNNFSYTIPKCISSRQIYSFRQQCQSLQLCSQE